ncbi:MAG: hypothetical protein LDL19_08070 [Thiobacillus sp.]|nr:hypothetical protein [Thiobacillus sp.]
MTDLFEMLSTITLRRKQGVESPFATPRSTEKWLRNLPGDSDYDTHHALVEGLERYNAENATATPARMNALLKIEEAGLPLQGRIVEQYLRNQLAFRLARQALWRESWIFWSLMAEAWLTLLKQAYRGPNSEELKPQVAEIAVRALRYAGLTMRWDFHQARTPAESGWRRVHKIYRLIERDGFAIRPVTLNARPTHCAREYTLIVLMGLVHPLGYRAQEIESIAQILDGYEPLPLPEKLPRKGEHTHGVDLSLAEGANVLDGEWVQGRRLRYFALRPLIDYLKSLDQTDRDESGLTRQMASLIERGGVRRARQRTHRFGRVWVAAGIEPILTALALPGNSAARPALESWMLRDESTEGMGFALSEAHAVPHGRLLAVSWDPAESVWQLLATRWTREEGGQWLVGTQRLSRHPKRVEVYYDAETPELPQEKTGAVFLPLPSAEEGLSNLLLPPSHYRLGARLLLRDGDALYRLRLGEVQESHEGWLRVAMDVVGREQFAAAA